MGKRNKTQKSEDTCIKRKKKTFENEEDNLINEPSSIVKEVSKKKEIKKERIPQEIPINVSNSDSRLDEIVPHVEKSKKKKKLKKAQSSISNTENSFKSKKIVFVDDEPREVKEIKKERLPQEIPDVSNADSKLDEISKQKKKLKKVQSSISNPENSSKSKKIVFVDDEPHEVSNSPEVPINAVKQKKFLNDDEAEVKDEDIDKFCDDLDEEDNKQYEDWVKLVEAKLHGNKTKKN